MYIESGMTVRRRIDRPLRNDNVVSSKCRVRFGGPWTRSGKLHSCDSTVAGLAMRRAL